MCNLEEMADQRRLMTRLRGQIAALEAERGELLDALRLIAYRTGGIALPEAVAIETMLGLWETATAAIVKAERRTA